MNRYGQNWWSGAPTPHSEGGWVRYYDAIMELRDVVHEPLVRYRYDSLEGGMVGDRTEGAYVQWSQVEEIQAR